MAKSQNQFAAMFLDYENIFYFLRPRLVDADRAQDVMIELIRSLREFVETERNERCIIQHAYADFEEVEANAMGPLYLIGVETHNVLGTGHKNAADMRMCIDILETMYTRDEIDTFILLAGDRDYIPVIQHLKKHARNVLTVAFKDNVSGDLLTNVGKGFIDATELLSKISRSELEVGEERMKENRREERRIAEIQREEVRQIEPVRIQEAVFSKAMSITDRDTLTALEILLQNYGDKPEVWFSPFLNKLRQSMQHLAEYERKALITNLSDMGAVKVEKRRGEPHDFSVIIINWKHPDVKTLNPGFEA